MLVLHRCGNTRQAYFNKYMLQSLRGCCSVSVFVQLFWWNISLFVREGRNCTQLVGYSVKNYAEGNESPKCFYEQNNDNRLTQQMVPSHFWKNVQLSSMFVPCILDVVEMTNNMRWFYHSFILQTGSTCLGSSLPSSGSFLNSSTLLELQMEWVLYHIMFGYVACVLKMRSTTDGTTTIRHTGHVSTHYVIYHPFHL
jgi:hypothetical protein